MEKQVVLNVPLRGALATELRRIAANLDIDPKVLVKDIVIGALHRDYGIIVK